MVLASNPEKGFLEGAMTSTSPRESPARVTKFRMGSFQRVVKCGSREVPKRGLSGSREENEEIGDERRLNGLLA